MGKQTKPESLSFEQALNELQSVVEQLEAGQLSLQDSLTLYQRGRQLSRHCNALLDAAETQIESETPSENED